MITMMLIRGCLCWNCNFVLRVRVERHTEPFSNSCSAYRVLQVFDEVLLCLVVTGMSYLGDNTFDLLPYRHGTKHRYNSFVDSLSNPEIFVATASPAALPAYLIRYS